MFYTEKYTNIVVQGYCSIVGAALLFILAAMYTGDWATMMWLMWTYELLAFVLWTTISVTVLNFLDTRRHEKDQRIARRKRYYGFED